MKNTAATRALKQFAVTHVLYRSDFRDSSMWDFMLEMYGIEQSEEDGIQYDEITIRATLEDYS